MKLLYPIFSWHSIPLGPLSQRGKARLSSYRPSFKEWAGPGLSARRRSPCEKVCTACCERIPRTAPDTCEEREHRARCLWRNSTPGQTPPPAQHPSPTIRHGSPHPNTSPAVAPHHCRASPPKLSLDSTRNSPLGWV